MSPSESFSYIHGHCLIKRGFTGRGWNDREFTIEEIVLYLTISNIETGGFIVLKDQIIKELAPRLYKTFRAQLR